MSGFLFDSTITIGCNVGRSFETDRNQPQAIKFEAGIIPGSVRIRMSHDWLLLDKHDLDWLIRTMTKMRDHAPEL